MNSFLSSCYLTIHISKNECFFTLSEDDREAGISNDTKTRIPNVAVEITRRFRLSLESEDMYATYLISLSKLQLEEQLWVATKLNIKNINRLQSALNAIVKYIEDNKLKH